MSAGASTGIEGAPKNGGSLLASQSSGLDDRENSPHTRPADRFVSLWSALLVAALCSGCDSEADQPITAADLAAISSACIRNGGVSKARRAAPMFEGYEWRVDCADGARFTFKARQ